MERNRTLFGPAKSSKLSGIVRIDTVQNARESAIRLQRIFGRAQKRKNKVTVKRATVQAANRAKVISENDKISMTERAEAKRVAELYKNVYSRMRI